MRATWALGVAAVGFREDLSTCPSTGGSGAFGGLGGTWGDYWDFGDFGDNWGEWNGGHGVVWEDLLMRWPKRALGWIGMD